MEAVTAYLGLGSNLGQRRKNLEEAARILFRPVNESTRKSATGQDSSQNQEAPIIELRRSSSVYETVPWGYADQPDFLNCVLEIRTTLSPLQLLQLAKDVERELGREWSPRYGPRVIDLDILFWGSAIINEADLQIPHPRLHQRAFVLMPLAELAPRLVHPELCLTVSQLNDGIDGKSGVKLCGPPIDPTPGDGVGSSS